jgi:dihydrofolate reductase
MKLLSIIVAKSKNDVIGNNGRLPWHLSEDLKRFKSITMGKPIIMGRVTYESIGKPLPGRENIILTRRSNYLEKGITIIHSSDEALKSARDSDEVIIIGGGEIYKEFLSRVNRLYITHVDLHIDGDAFFPKVDYLDWQVMSREDFPVNKDREIGFCFEVLERR